MHLRFTAGRDLYALLDLNITANLNEVRAAYRRAALIAHPDKGGTAEAFHAITLAFEVLSCSTTRRLYNQTYIRQTYIRQLHLRRHRLAAVTKAAKSKLATPNLDKVCTLKTGMKRPVFCSDNALQPRKRRCCQRPLNTPAAKCGVCSSPKRTEQQVVAINDALGCMRTLLQSMTAAQRLTALEHVTPCVRIALLSFMQKSQSVPAPNAAAPKHTKEILGYKKLNRCKPLPAQSGVRVTKSSVGTRYRAHLVIKGLRLYTNTSSHAAAIEHHIIFVQMREALAAESGKDPCIWTHPEKLLGIFNGILADNSTSAIMIDLHVFVYMRGTPFLDKNTYIISPTMQLDQAVPLYARLLRAQCTSWEALRAEWVYLLQLKQKSNAKGQLRAEAEMIADQARQKALNFRLRQAEKVAKRVMKREEQKTKKAHAAAEREQRRSVAADAKAEVWERKAARQRLLMWKARRKGLRQGSCKDMTMEDIMRRNL